MKCSICNNPISGESNNPLPLPGKACCSECNIKVVVPLRLFQSGVYPDQALLISTEGKLDFAKPKNGVFNLKELQSLVQGFIEIYPIRMPNHLVIVNEEGLIHKMPFNRLAELAFGIEAVGPVLICPKLIFE
jgi:hypothetical protein